MQKGNQSPTPNRPKPTGRRTRGSTDDSKTQPPRTPTPTSTTSTRQGVSPGQGGSGVQKPLPVLVPAVAPTIPVPAVARVAHSRKRSGSTIASIASSTHHSTSDVASTISNVSSETLHVKPTAKHDNSRIPNVLIFGETGAGKSSIINMIAGQDVAGVSSSASGCTFGSQSYVVSLDDQQLRLWDTAGLNEGDRGTVPAEQAVRNLRDLVVMLSEGINLLVYCVRGNSRFRDVLKVNYDLFFGTICDKRVPIVIVVTGLEHQKPMESWWTQNVEQFDKNGLAFNGHACVTATRGKQGKAGAGGSGGGYMYEMEFESSKVALQKLVLDHFERSPVRWIQDKDAWVSEMAAKIASYYNTGEGVKSVGLVEHRRGWPHVYMWCALFVVSLTVFVIIGKEKFTHGL